ncbi:HAMP domain-containing histidine kinase [Clostridium estertheticum]|uniref:HAMP domain-containing sensor histidine kinase n=1 Tax=Clostridium estertheticum TaxID=238834 RepID=UPI001CCC363B|nr:HAMP domain-containing sensor histidine kinase [Clostridium estertheticum]MBZ9607700.1 HAMP domain-containing histidine kinase [Clostridium estertheticum]
MNESKGELTKYSTIAINYAKLGKGPQDINVDIFSNIKYVTFSVFDESETLLYSTEKDKKNLSFHEDSSPFPFTNNLNQQSVSVTTKLDLNNEIIFLQFSKNLDKENEYGGIFTSIIFIINIFSLIITLDVGSKESKKMLLPIKNMTKATKAISINALETRINVSNSHDELKHLAENFNEMLDRIQNSYEIQNQFVSDASHELRTPIAVIKGYANMLYRWGKDDKAVLEESITAIKGESENMQQLVEKLLFLARSDKNTQKVSKEEFYINQLVDEIIKETKLIDDYHEISTNINEETYIYADKNLLKQALRIFIDNSIKYTQSGGSIKLNSYVRKNKLIIEIIDTGIGIFKEDLPYIFNRFYRCDKSRAKESGGTGLGLSIAKWIIGEHNGSIVVESKPKMGTTIRIGLPLKNKL